LIYLHKILPLFLSPLFLILVMMGVGIITRKRLWVVAAALLLYVASIPLTSMALMRLLEGPPAKLATEDAPIVDAIVVLGGMIEWVQTSRGIASEWGDPDRFWDGVALFKAGRAPLLVFTGGKLPWQLGDETEGEVLKRYAQFMQVPAGSIWVTEKVENTAEEAQAVAKMLQPAKRKIILVTSAFHMNRAKGLFDQLGFEVFPFPVDFKAAASVSSVTSLLPSPNALGGTDLCIRELFGRLYYQVRRHLH
jgi:uncharacterized SAM-binding protein YcdF (DUF218 family)